MKKALLIIDVQFAAIKEHTRALPEKIEKLQAHYSRIFVSRFVNAGSPLIKIMDWPGYDNEELAFSPAPQAVVFEKNIYSSFLPAMSDFDEIHLCGFDTDACVYKTALDLVEHGIRPLVLADYCGSASENIHRAGIELLKRNIGEENIFFGRF